MIDALRRVIAGDAPVFLLVAGPNGAGKSTYRERRLEPLGFPCIDPDAVGLELFGRHPQSAPEAIEATKEATQRARKRFQVGQSVGLETVFSSNYKLALLNEAHALGLGTLLVFIGVDSVQISIARVMDRVEHGGHDVLDEVIEARFPRCFENLKAAMPIADLTVLVDNSGCYGPMVEAADAPRHYEFGIYEHGACTKLANPLPHWFTRFGIPVSIAAP